MRIQSGIIFVGLMLFSGCAPLVPVIIGSGGTAAYFYYQEKAEGVYRVSLDDAYPIAVRTLGTMDLEIVEIEMGDQQRVLSARNPADDSKRVTFTLETASDGFTKATVRAINHTVIPDRAYGKMVLQMFGEEIDQRLGRNRDGKVAMGRR